MKRAILLIAALVGLSGQTAPRSTEMTSPAAFTVATPRHLVYRFGYNAKPTDSGPGTGTITIDVVGQASDGGLTINATEDWWNSVSPKQSSSCELYPSGAVSCAERPYLLLGIEAVIAPLLARNYFSALSTGPNATWNANYDVRASFTPGIYADFAGQLSTWSCAYTLNGAGVVPNEAPLIVVHLNGAMNQKDARRFTLKQEANVVVDPRINVPVFVSELLTPVPQLNVNQYTVDLRLLST